MKTGILGGTFDPVHNGHLAMARAARDDLALDQVLLLPAGDPWRKTQDRRRKISAAEHRLAMLKLAVAGDDTLGICDIELRTSGPSYTADTLEALAAERLDDAFWFIIGADALADIPHWKDPARIVRHAMLAVTERAGFDLDDATRSAVAAVPQFAGRIVRFTMTPWNESSSEIRRRARTGDPLDNLVPPAVATYIKKHNLYVD